MSSQAGVISGVEPAHDVLNVANHPSDISRGRQGTP